MTLNTTEETKALVPAGSFIRRGGDGEGRARSNVKELEVEKSYWTR